MNLDELKAKFRNKARVDIKDTGLAMRAVPILVRALEELEAKFVESEKRNNHLNSLVNKKRPPLEKKGKKENAEWMVRADEEKNRVYMELSGEFNYRCAKLASNAILTVQSALREGFDVINDISKKGTIFDKRSSFHIRKIIYNMQQAGMGKFVNVTASSTGDTAKLFETLVNSSGAKAIQATSVEGAEGMLENVGKFLKA